MRNWRTHVALRNMLHKTQVRVTSCALVVAAALTLIGCGGRGEAEVGQQATGGDIKVGQHLIYAYGCGTCHVIPGVVGANGTAGPTLEGFGSRYYVAGLLVNTPENLFHWISKPQEIDPVSAMPNLGITERQARDIAAYLYTLQ